MRRPFILFWVLIAVLILFFWVYFPTISQYRELKFQQDDIEQQIQVLDGKILVLKEEKRRLQEDSKYLERVIRKELGLVKPGEIVYKFVTASPKPSPAGSQTAQNTD